MERLNRTPYKRVQVSPTEQRSDPKRWTEGILPPTGESASSASMREIRVSLALFLHEHILIPYGNHGRVISKESHPFAVRLNWLSSVGQGIWDPGGPLWIDMRQGGESPFRQQAHGSAHHSLQLFAASLTSCWPREWGALRFRGSKHGYDSIDGMRTHACLRFQ